MNELPSRSYNANLHVNQAHYQNLVKILYNYIWIEFNWFNLLDDTISMLDTHWSIIIWQKGWSLMYQVKIIIYIYMIRIFWKSQRSFGFNSATLPPSTKHAKVIPIPMLHLIHQHRWRDVPVHYVSPV